MIANNIIAKNISFEIGRWNEWWHIFFSSSMLREKSMLRKPHDCWGRNFPWKFGNHGSRWINYLEKHRSLDTRYQLLWHENLSKMDCIRGIRNPTPLQGEAGAEIPVGGQNARRLASGKKNRNHTVTSKKNTVRNHLFFRFKIWNFDHKRVLFSLKSKNALHFCIVFHVMP